MSEELTIGDIQELQLLRKLQKEWKEDIAALTDDRRKVALSEANRYPDSPEDVVKRAEAYLRFLAPNLKRERE